MSRKITIKEIAEHCGVSMATVSRAINGSSYVHAEVSKKIREYIEDVGWKSNSISTKIHSKINLDVVVVASLRLLEGTGQTQAFKMLLEELYAAGYSPVVLLGHRADSLQRCLKERPSLVILYGVSDRLCDDIKLLVDAGIRIVGSGSVHNPPCPLVMSDHRSAARSAAELLYKSGVRKIALCGAMGAQPHPTDLGKIYSRSARIIQGIQDVFPAFDYKKDAVSDCFGNLTEFKSMYSSSLYDGWIFDAPSYLDLIVVQEGLASVMEKRIILLQGYAQTPVSPVCSRIFVENLPAQVRKIIELIQKTSTIGNEEHLVPYFGVSLEKI